MYRLADFYRPLVRLLLTRDHPEQRRFARAVRAYHTDDAARRQLESEIVDKEVVTETFGQMVKINDVLAEPFGDGNGDLRDDILLRIGDLEQFLVALIAGLGFCLPRFR